MVYLTTRVSRSYIRARTHTLERRGWLSPGRNETRQLGIVQDGLVLMNAKETGRFGLHNRANSTSTLQGVSQELYTFGIAQWRCPSRSTPINIRKISFHGISGLLRFVFRPRRHSQKCEKSAVINNIGFTRLSSFPPRQCKKVL